MLRIPETNFLHGITSHQLVGEILPPSPPAGLSRHLPDRVHFLDNRKQRYPHPSRDNYLSRLAIAITIPVTHVVKQKNSRRSPTSVGISRLALYLPCACPSCHSKGLAFVRCPTHEISRIVSCNVSRTRTRSGSRA